MTFTQKDIEDFKKSFRKIDACFDENYIRTKLSECDEFNKSYELYFKFRKQFENEIRKAEAKVNSLKGKRTVTRKVRRA